MIPNVHHPLILTIYSFALAKYKHVKILFFVMKTHIVIVHLLLEKPTGFLERLRNLNYKYVIIITIIPFLYRMLLHSFVFTISRCKNHTVVVHLLLQKPTGFLERLRNLKYVIIITIIPLLYRMPLYSFVFTIYRC